MLDDLPAGANGAITPILRQTRSLKISFIVLPGTRSAINSNTQVSIELYSNVL